MDGTRLNGLIISTGLKKMTMNTRNFILLIILASIASSCSNKEAIFPDYSYQSVYFAYQFPIRTITLGESNTFVNTLDNQHKFEIYATTGGVYDNKHDVTVNFEVDTSLVSDMLFNSNGDEIKALPKDYYQFESEKFIIPKGKLIGGVVVDLTDQFFADPDAIKNTYVIPIKITDVVNADTVLSGQPKFSVSDPRLGLKDDWDVAPKNFTFYAVKYINEWDGLYLRRGTDIIKANTGSPWDTTIYRHEQDVTDDEVIKMSTESLNQVDMPLSYKDQDNTNLNVTAVLKFDDQGKCIVGAEPGSSYSISGDGMFVKDGAKNSWGGEDRNVIYLNFVVTSSNLHVATKDTLVLRDRGVSMETFSPVLK
jgi:hypothetical protein